MATFADVIARVKLLLGSDASLSDSEIISLTQTRYEHVYETFHWSKRRKDFVITLFPQIVSSASTLVNVANGSPTVTSIGTPFTIAMIGAQIKIGTERQYFFVNYASSSTIILQDGEGNNVDWPGATATSQSWSIFKTIYQLPAGSSDIISLVGTDPLSELDGGRPRLDEMDPDRLTTCDQPQYWCYAGAERTKAIREVEIWPVPTAAHLLRGQCNRDAPTLALNHIIDVPVPILVYSCAADGCHLLHAKQGSTETMWENKALFFERKSLEVWKDYKVNDFEMTSPPTHLGRSINRHAALSGTDYAVNHDTEIS
jgi:hypothetical protein